MNDFTKSKGMKKSILWISCLLLLPALAFAGGTTFSMIEISTTNNAPVKYRIITNSGLEVGITDHRQILQPGKYRLEIVSDNKMFPEILYQSGLNVLPKQRMAMLYDPVNGLSVVERKGFKYNPRKDDGLINDSSLVASRDAAMRGDLFQGIMEDIRGEIGQQSRFEKAKEYISQNYFFAPQVQQMLELFPQDYMKIKVAAFAYLKTVDPENYSEIFTHLNSNHSKQSLNRMIGGALMY